MKNKILFSLAIMIGFAPIQATIVRDVLETGKQIAIASYKTAQDAAEFVVENSWKAPVGSQKNGGKIVVSAAALVLAADQAAKFHALSQYKKRPIINDDTNQVIGWQYLDKNNNPIDPNKIYKTIPSTIIDFYYNYPFIRNVTLGLISMAIYMTFDKHIMGETHNPTQFKIAQPDETFPKLKDIIGAENAKTKLKEFAESIKKQKQCFQLGAQSTKGCLLWGIPGTGKTELARAMAQETKLPLVHMNGSINTVWRGSGTAQLQKLEKTAQKLAPCIVYIDEIDNLAGRSSEMGWSSDTNATTNTFKSMLDGFEKQDPEKPIFFIGSTNNISNIDPAILRNGRMPGIEVTPPTLEEFQTIINHKLFKSGKFKANPNIDTSNFKNIFTANKTTGADASALLNDAALHAAFNNKKEIDQESINHAIKQAQKNNQSLLDITKDSTTSSWFSNIFG